MNANDGCIMAAFAALLQRVTSCNNLIFQGGKKEKHYE